MIRNTKSYHIIGSLLQEYRFGHHGAYLFPEFQLGNSLQPDYLLVGDRSGGHEFLFVELENPYNKITLLDGYAGDTMRKGLKQIDQWKRWIQKHYMSLIESFAKETNKSLPREFYELDTTRIHYALVVGRRSDFNDTTYNTKRSLLKEQSINLLHYDNLYDLAEKIIDKST